MINKLYLWKTRCCLWLECIDTCECVFLLGTLLSFFDDRNVRLVDLVLNHKFIIAKNICFQKKFYGVKFYRFFVWQTYTKDLLISVNLRQIYCFLSYRGGGGKVPHSRLITLRQNRSNCFFTQTPYVDNLINIILRLNSTFVKLKFQRSY